MSENNQTTLTQVKQNQVAEIKPGFESMAAFEALQRVAKVFALSEFVPKDYKGDSGLPSCMIAVNIALRAKADPLLVMQNLIIVYGKPSWSAKYLIASANTCGRFTSIRFEYFGEPNTDNWGCRAIATELATKQELVGPDITIKLAKDEGWYTKNGSKWKTIPQKMLMWRAGAWWVDLYCPEIAMGFKTAEEEADIIDIDLDGNIKNIKPANEVTTSTVRNSRKDVTPKPEVNNTTETLTEPKSEAIACPITGEYLTPPITHNEAAEAVESGLSVAELREIPQP